MPTSEIKSTTARLRKPSTCFACSPPISSQNPGGRFFLRSFSFDCAGPRLGESTPGAGKRIDGPEMLATPNSSGLEDVADFATESSGTLVFCCDEYVEILNLPKLRPLLPTETSHNGDALIALFQQANGCAAYGGRSGIRYIGIRYPDNIGAIGINQDLHLWASGDQSSA